MMVFVLLLDVLASKVCNQLEDTLLIESNFSSD